MPRVVSFIVLAAVLLLIGSMFFQVVLQFAVPLFLAAVLVVVFEPLHKWVCSKWPNYPRASALATTVLILLIVLLPALWLGWHSFTELRVLIERYGEESEREALVATFNDRAEGLLTRYEQMFGARPNLPQLFERLTGTAGGAVLSGLTAMARLLVGLAIMLLAVYYFLVDGPMMLATVMRLSPLEERYENELLDRFANVSRAVVLASLLSAIAQGLLAGAGYFVVFSTRPDTNAQQAAAAEGGGGAAGEFDAADAKRGSSAADSSNEKRDDDAPVAHGAPVMLLTMLTMVMAIVPFVGAASVWILVSLGVWLIDGRPIAAGVLAAYCGIVVSTVDNLIKPLVLHGQSNLHPLLALISVLGGVQVLGPVGIIVGPMLVAFVQALLVMVNRELKDWDNADGSSAGLIDQAGSFVDEMTASPSEGAANQNESSESDATRDPQRLPSADAKGSEPSPVSDPPSKRSRSRRRKRRRKPPPSDDM